MCAIHTIRAGTSENKKKEIFFSLSIRISLVNYHVENEMRVLVKVARLGYYILMHINARVSSRALF